MSTGALRTLVIVLGVFILLAFATVVWGIIGTANLEGNGEIAKDLHDLRLGLPIGCNIRGTQSTGDRLTIVTDGPANLRAKCSRVFVIDTASGEIKAKIRP
ncbi:MAG: hypothetical protein OSB67_06080 [Alphaproteobacteria bacterium]|jgi:hypothetical protein|nr:hypothetical protein [Alphaproteobacteria bacterium]